MRKEVICLAALMLSSVTLSAQENGWLLRAVAGWNTFGGPLQISQGDDGVRAGFNDEVVFGLEGEYRWGRRLGLELALHQSRPTLRVFTEDPDGFSVSSDAIAFRPVTLGLDIHLTPGRRADFTLTPLVGYAFFGDLSLGGDRFSGDDTFVWGGAAAVDLAIGEGPWALSFAVRYLEADYRVTGDEADYTTVEVSPWTSTLGVSYRF